MILLAAVGVRAASRGNPCRAIDAFWMGQRRRFNSSISLTEGLGHAGKYELMKQIERGMAPRHDQVPVRCRFSNRDQ
jgi:hypothetical protein